ncbi:MAG: TatD family hydrolase [Candidatus Saccharibacteria bacterium]|nr:TatD family hydrolase [Candidatus Saccharibacteria bacterium]
MTDYFIDTHCHLHDPEFFPGSVDTFIQQAYQQNVRQIIVIGTSHQDSLLARDFALKYSTSESSSAESVTTFWTYGIHPSEYQLPRPQPDFSVHRPIAIGEVGLDYHYQPYDRSAQIQLFESMIDLAAKQRLPLVFHVREAFDDFFAVIDNFPQISGVVHSFSDNKSNLEKALARNLYIGVNGLATFVNLPTPPLERILLETDAPFLAPVPFRGRTNQPAYVRNIADWLAHQLQLPLAKIAATTSSNARTLFQLPTLN